MKFKRGDRVIKTKGSNWRGRVVGEYSTTLTPEGYAVESDTEKGSVQIYPASALAFAPYDRADLQAQGVHPAPCARHCEANAFAIEIRTLRRERDALLGALKRCLPIIQADAQMMADISRHAPLSYKDQMRHDMTEYESERLVREIPALIASVEGGAA